MEESQPAREAVVYLYVREFAYKDKRYEEMMGGHPKTGRIYRALYDKDTNMYRVILEEEDKSEHGLAGLMLQNLTSEDPRWSADIVVMDDESMIQYDIVSDDFIKLAKWRDEENHDIDYLRLDQGVASIESDPETGMTTVVFSEDEEMEEDVTEHLANLSEVDYELAKAVNKTVEGIMHYLAAVTPDNPDFTILASNHRIHGRGVNVGLAIEALSDYLNQEQVSKGTLNKAVYYLLREMARINK